VGSEKNLKVVAHPGASGMNSYRERDEKRAEKERTELVTSERKSNNEDEYFASYNSKEYTKELPSSMNRSGSYQDYNNNGNYVSNSEKEDQSSKDFSVKIDKRMFTQSPNSFLKNWQEGGMNNKENKNPSVVDSSQIYQTGKGPRDETEIDLNARFQNIDVSNISLGNGEDPTIDRSVTNNNYRNDNSYYNNNTVNPSSPYKASMKQLEIGVYKDNGEKGGYNTGNAGGYPANNGKHQFKLPIQEFAQSMNANTVKNAVHNRNVSTNLAQGSYYEPRDAGFSNSLKANNHKGNSQDFKLIGDKSYKQQGKNAMSPISPQRVKGQGEKVAGGKDYKNEAQAYIMARYGGGMNGGQYGKN